jgi:SPP1 gp7 family putative phage head morphogenesis protein
MNDSLIDSLTRHQVWLQRLGSYEANTFNPVLAQADKNIREILSRSELSTQSDLDQVIGELKSSLDYNYSGWTDSLINDLEGVSESEANFDAKILENSTTLTGVAAAIFGAWAMARRTPIQVNQNGEAVQMIPFIKSLTATESRRVIGVVRNGFNQGLGNQQIIQRIRGTKKNNFTDGILQITRRNAAAIARTSVNHIATTARMASLEQNKKVLSGWQFIATLDSRTTNICRFNDGLEFKIGEGPLPPLHVGCRSTIVPVVKNKYRLFPRDTSRASKGAEGGKQTKKSPYYDWLKTQPKWFQQSVLGKTRTELFRKGGLSTEEFRKLSSDNFGQPLTLEEMERLNPRAFEAAGVDNS